jgi:UDP-N-acetylglucosamine diphosphorylase/glucosamine-1-phosphate N-acetyltransferase
MNIYLDDSGLRGDLYPLAELRHVSDIRVGILTIREKWEHLLGCAVGDQQQLESLDSMIRVPANWVPNADSYKELLTLAKQRRSLPAHLFCIQYAWDALRLNDQAIRDDVCLLTSHRTSQSIVQNVRCVSPESIFIEEGVQISHAILNASEGPIYLGKNVLVMEGVCIRGPFAAGEGVVIKMGATIYGATSIGPGCTIGGEIKNSIILSYSNKAHHGYLGDSYLGSWCNLGAGTSCSNVLNSAASVYYALPARLQKVEAGQKAGLIMGDFSRSAINTSFNTGTITGVSCNVFSAGFPPKHIPSFTWGTEHVYQLDKAIEHAANWKRLKNQVLTDSEIHRLQQCYLQFHPTSNSKNEPTI